MLPYDFSYNRRFLINFWNSLIHPYPPKQRIPNDPREHCRFVIAVDGLSFACLHVPYNFYQRKISRFVHRLSHECSADRIGKSVEHRYSSDGSLPCWTIIRPTTWDHPNARNAQFWRINHSLSGKNQPPYCLRKKNATHIENPSLLLCRLESTDIDDDDESNDEALSILCVHSL